MDWLLCLILPYFLLLLIVASFSYICLSFRLYQMGIAERSRVKKKSAFVALLLSMSVFAGSILLGFKLADEGLLLTFLFLFE